MVEILQPGPNENDVVASLNGLTGDVTLAAGTNINLGTVGNTITINSTGENALTFSTGLTRTLNTITANISTGITGGQTAIGGTAVTDILKLQGTTGNGTLTSPAIQFLVGNNGATVAGTILNNGNFGVNTDSPNYGLEVMSTNIGSSGTLTSNICPSFDAGNWTGTNGWSADGSTLTKVAGASTGTIQPSGTGANPVIGRTYKVTIVVSAVSGSVTWTYGGVGGTSPSTTLSTGTRIEYVIAKTTGKLIFSGAAATTATITSVTIEPITADTGDITAEDKLYTNAIRGMTSTVDAMRVFKTGQVTFGGNVIPMLTTIVTIEGSGSSSPPLLINSTDLSTSLSTGRTFGGGVAGESFNRFLFYSDGKVAIGPGNATRDTILSRYAANTFRISSDGTTGTGKLIVNTSLGIGSTALTYDLSLGGDVARTIAMERFTTANTAGSTLNIQSGGATSGATDKNAGMFTLSPGISTGTGFASVRIQRLTRAASTGTGDNTLVDAHIIASEKSVTAEGSVNLFEISLPSNSAAGGFITYQIIASDGTDFQSHAGHANFACVNKAGTTTEQIAKETATDDANAGSAGAITPTWSITPGTNKETISVSIACSSIVANDIKIYYTLHNGSRQTITQL